MPTSGEVSLYFHIPFCSRKCPYCHFYVLPNDESLKSLLMEALALEWQSILPKLAGKRIVSIYFGGGTPTLLGPEAIHTILEKIERPQECEITLEANPENVSAMPAFAAAGINRVSIGVQSLDDSSLMTLERQHNAQTALAAIETTYRAGIKNISIDLMYDLPNQTLESWERTLSHLAALPITHLSLYNLTFEPATVFFKKRKELQPLVPTPDLSLQMLEKAVSHLEKIGLMRYEISAFAKQGFASRHNSGYWTARPFLGLGPSAFSYWEGRRFRNMAHLKNYAAALQRKEAPLDFEETLSPTARLAELLAIELRLTAGVDLPTFQQRHGPIPPSLLESLLTLHTKGWLQENSSRIQLTETGRLFYDSVGEELVQLDP